MQKIRADLREAQHFRIFGGRRPPKIRKIRAERSFILSDDNTAHAAIRPDLQQRYVKNCLPRIYAQVEVQVRM